MTLSRIAPGKTPQNWPMTGPTSAWTGSKLIKGYSLMGLIRFMSITARIGPTAPAPTRPKLSSSACLLSLRSLEMPTAKAMMKGTTKIPVTEPEESKAMAKNSGEVREVIQAKTKMSP